VRREQIGSITVNERERIVGVGGLDGRELIEVVIDDITDGKIVRVNACSQLKDIIVVFCCKGFECRDDPGLVDIDLRPFDIPV